MDPAATPPSPWGRPSTQASRAWAHSGHGDFAGQLTSVYRATPAHSVAKPPISGHFSRRARRSVGTIILVVVALGSAGSAFALRGALFPEAGDATTRSVWQNPGLDSGSDAAITFEFSNVTRSPTDRSASAPDADLATEEERNMDGPQATTTVAPEATTANNTATTMPTAYTATASGPGSPAAAPVVQLDGANDDDDNTSSSSSSGHGSTATNTVADELEYEQDDNSSATAPAVTTPQNTTPSASDADHSSGSRSTSSESDSDGSETSGTDNGGTDNGGFGPEDSIPDPDEDNSDGD